MIRTQQIARLNGAGAARRQNMIDPDGIDAHQAKGFNQMPDTRRPGCAGNLHNTAPRGDHVEIVHITGGGEWRGSRYGD